MRKLITCLLILGAVQLGAQDLNHYKKIVDFIIM